MDPVARPFARMLDVLGIELRLWARSFCVAETRSMLKVTS